jgi:hypothetical protein
MKNIIKHAKKASYDRAIQQVVSRNGWDLESMSHEAPTLIIFLRHLGCVYCRESLTELMRLRPEIESRGVRIALVHMGNDTQAREVLEVFGLDDVERFSDQEQRLYKAFDLERSQLGSFFSPATLFDMLKTSFSFRTSLWHSVGKVVGDALQMPGVFLLSDGQIVGNFKAESLTERPDYLELAALKC